MSSRKAVAFFFRDGNNYIVYIYSSLDLSEQIFEFFQENIIDYELIGFNITFDISTPNMHIGIHC